MRLPFLRMRSIGAMPTARILAERALSNAERELLEAHEAVDQAEYDLHAAKHRVHGYQVKIARLREYLREN